MHYDYDQGEEMHILGEASAYDITALAVGLYADA